MQLSSLNVLLESGISATKIALAASGDATRKMAALAERCTNRAESEGLRAEEECSRRILAEQASAKQVSVFVLVSV